jgi:hypothetical protein
LQKTPRFPAHSKRVLNNAGYKHVSGQPLWQVTLNIVWADLHTNSYAGRQLAKNPEKIFGIL